MENMLKLHFLFTDHMVFAADKPIRIWGEGDGEIRVRMGERQACTRAKDGRWMIELEGLPCGGAYGVHIESEAEKITLKDVYVGYVYLCGGQSNMQMKLGETDFDEARYADESRLRFFAARPLKEDGNFTPSDGWMCSTADTAARRSAIGYIMGMERVRQSGCAVGVIGCCQGGSVIESWLPEGVLEGLGAVLSPEDKYKDPCRLEWWNETGELYHYALADLMPFSLSGVIWYQGESNAREAEGRIYERQLRALIKKWREDFKDGELPFVVVQLPEFARPASKTGWAMVQQAQQSVEDTVENVARVQSRDGCSDRLIHPIEKEALSLRIARTLAQ